MESLFVDYTLTIPLKELHLSFNRSPGPGGQNVNHLNTRVELRFRPADSQALSSEQKRRLVSFLRSQLTLVGDLIVRSSRYRSQARNRQDCLEKLKTLLHRGLAPPRPKRRPTKPSRAAMARRMDAKRLKSQRKSLRRRPSLD